MRFLGILGTSIAQLQRSMLQRLYLLLLAKNKIDFSTPHMIMWNLKIPLSSDLILGNVINNG